jgi:outer membrane protein
MKERLRLVSICLLALLMAPPMSVEGAELPLFRIGVVVDGPWSIDRETGSAVFEEEILKLTRGEFDVRMAAETLVGDDTVEGVERALDRLLADPQIDLIIAGGVIASHVAGHRKGLSKPVVAPLVIDAEVQGIPLQGQVSGVENLCYIASPVDVQRDLEVFREVVPFERIGLLYAGSIGDAVPELVEYALAQMRELGIEGVPVPVGAGGAEALERLPDEVEAVFVGLPLHLRDGEVAALAAGLIERKLPSFTAFGSLSGNQVEAGLMVGLHADADIGRLARRVALNVQRILLGEEPGSLPVLFSRQERLTINVETANAVGVYPSWAVLTEAVLVGAAPEEEIRQLTLMGAVQEAVRVNLDLAVNSRAVAAGAQEVGQARAALLPQVDLNGTGAVIDADLVSPAQPERSVSGSGSLTQVIYSEGARANLSIQRYLQRGRRLEREQLILDVVKQTATAYLDLLRAQTFERIQKENLKLTRSNLELARLRQKIGMSGLADVYRWDSQIATGRKSVIAANARRNLAEINLNRILHRPQEDRVAVAETGLHDESLVTHQVGFMKYMGSKRNFGVLRAFMVEDGLASAPELQRLDAAISAQERGLEGARRALWSPTLAFQGNVTNEFYDAGKGSQEPFDERNWTLGLNLNFPIFSGGAKLAARRGAAEEMERLQLERQALAERIEQRIRSAAHLAGASFAGIKLSADAAVAANKNLELVKDAYGRGTIGILGLLDAQNAAMLAEEGAANAVYDFLVDLMEVERSIGKFYFRGTQEQRDAWFARLEEYAESSVLAK